MLEVHCEHCGRVLIGFRQVIGLSNTPDGIEMAFVCGCGRPGGVLTGRAQAARAGAGAPVTSPTWAGNEVERE